MTAQQIIDSVPAEGHVLFLKAKEVSPSTLPPWLSETARVIVLVSPDGELTIAKDNYGTVKEQR